MQKFWVGGFVGHTTDPAYAQNWASVSGGAGGAGVPTASDDVVFDGNGNANAFTMTAALICNSITSLVGYTQAISDNGFNITTNTTISLSHAGALTWKGVWTILGDGNFYIGSTMKGTTTLNTNGLTMMGSGFIDGNGTTGPTPFVYNMVVAYPTKTVVFKQTTGTGFLVTPASNFTVNGGTFTVISASMNIFAGAVSTANWFNIVPGSVFNGTGKILINMTSGTNTSFNMPGFLYTGTGNVVIAPYATTNGVTVTANQTGPISAPNAALLAIVNAYGVALGTAVNTYNTNGYAITCGAFQYGTNNASNHFILNWGSTVLTCTSFGQYLTYASYYTHNFQTAAINCAGSFYIGSTAQYVVSYSAACQINIKGTGTFTSGTKSLPKVRFDAPGNTITWADACTMAGMSASPGTTVKFLATGTYIISAYAAGDWGSIKVLSSFAVFLSTIPGTRYNFTNPAAMPTVYNVNATDCNATNPVSFFGTGSNNINWTSIGPYTVPQFITNVLAGNPVQVIAPRAAMVLTIDGRSVFLSSAVVVRTVSSNSSSGGMTDALVDNSAFDLGALFSAQQVVSSLDLRQALDTGAVYALAGTVSLSKSPIV